MCVVSGTLASGITPRQYDALTIALYIYTEGRFQQLRQRSEIVRPEIAAHLQLAQFGIV